MSQDNMEVISAEGLFDVATIKSDFPILDQTQVGGDGKERKLVFLDSAASSQRPTQVLDAMNAVYETGYANVHRGVYQLAERATASYELGRTKVARFIGAPDSAGVIFTKNATESLNLVVGSWGRANLGPNDAVLLTMLEHHANIVPWQMLAAEKGFDIRWVPVNSDGELILDDLDQLLDGVKMFSFTAMSNVTGTLTPVRQLVDAAHAKGALACVDACQAVPHQPTSVTEWDADFVAFSGHKMLGPSGIGVLWGRTELLDEMPPFLGGGGMILNVTCDGFTPAELPAKFEAGTPPIAEAAGLGAAVDYLLAIGMDAIRQHEIELTAYAMHSLTEALGEGLTIHGPTEPASRGGVLSLTLDDVHAHDISQILDEQAVCIRPGHHCAKPLMRHFGVSATARASFYIYNDESDVDALTEALVAARKFFAF